jgi:hypothetical protein
MAEDGRRFISWRGTVETVVWELMINGRGWLSVH